MLIRPQNDFIQIDDEVSTELELTWILSEEERTGKVRTILFDNVKGYDIPVVGNIFFHYVPGHEATIIPFLQCRFFGK